MTTVDGEKTGLNATKALPAKPPRDRYFDALRAAAIIRVVVYHMFSVAWLSMIFPSMGVMFALGGSLMVKSVDRSTEQAITSRLRRLLPALWVFGAVLIPAMLWAGWAHRPSWGAFLVWVLPVIQPPASKWGFEATEVLWYLVTYLWFVLLSPFLLRLYRRMRLVTVIAPLVLLAVWDGLSMDNGGRAASAITDLLTFAACWVIGFAHREGDLRKIRLSAVAPVAVACAALGVLWTARHGGVEGIEDSPIGYGLYSLGFTLLLMRWSPLMAWLTRRPSLNGLVNFCNARAVTIFLWNNVAIALCFVVWDRVGVELSPTAETAAQFGVALALIAVFVALFGWVEDVAARRPVRVLPWSKVPASRPRKETPEWCGPVWF
jgi:peptidoglycan/LPS O-acetylase OafA/YrhL